MWGILGLLGIGYNLTKDAIQQNRRYYGTDRELFRNNPARQKEQIGSDRLLADLKNNVPPIERSRRRHLGYYAGEDVDISKK